ncbi:uncharacterized protein LOC128998252 [Macrosteles quadrilineatus]|uniref:uncharacterized protein LOC128998252 n=1 Tax=Macrosteles quadrilineatus TaxID=74068 RepID=UPI0023E1F636|nr:uncharacterized protein LOC128998252 [Macrosteles quadrilineatus]
MACLHSCIVLLAVAVAVALSLDIASAKPGAEQRVVGVRSAVRGAYPLRRRFTARGCSSFGHSCFGGHGKRSDEEFPPPEFLPPVEQEPENRVPLDNIKQADIVPLLRQWLQLRSYRRMAESNPN